jgi:hypothetical protein
MKPNYQALTGFFIAFVLISGLYGFYRSQQPVTTHDYVLPHDNFSKQTMDAIRSHLAQYNVMHTPQDHDVYMVTGGLGIANPRILGWDSGGNMNFAGNESGDPMYSIQETSQSPATWYTRHENKGVGWTNGTQEGFKPVPWVLKHTKSGVPYYEWDMIPYELIQFYFKKDNTFIVLKVDYMKGQPKPTFPQGLISHLVPLGNPVTKQN